jgi:putative endonuclease
MYYVYVLKSLVDGGLYIGCTVDLKNRIRSHANGSVESTRKRLPLELIYYEACNHRDDAFRRERYLKTTYGHRYIKHRLRSYFTG